MQSLTFLGGRTTQIILKTWLLIWMRPKQLIKSLWKERPRTCLLFCCLAVNSSVEMKKPWLWQAQTWTWKLQPSHSVHYARFHFKLMYTHKHNLVSNAVVILHTTKHPGSRPEVCLVTMTAQVVPCHVYYMMETGWMQGQTTPSSVCDQLLLLLPLFLCV